MWQLLKNEVKDKIELGTKKKVKFQFKANMHNQ